MRATAPFNAFALSFACLLLSPLPALASINAGVQVTSGGVQQTYQSTAAVPDVLSLGNVQGALQLSAAANCVGLACGFDGPAVGAYLGAGGQSDSVDTTILYTFEVVGAPGAVPILVTGQYAVLGPFDAPDRSGGTSATGVVDIRGSQGGLFNFQSLCYNYDPYNNEQAPATNCGSGTFQGSFLATAGTTVRVYMDASARRYLPDLTLPSVSAYIDPFFQIDPVFAATHAGYSLAFDPGVGNGMPGDIGTAAPVPEPETLALMASGLLALAVKRRRLARSFPFVR